MIPIGNWMRNEKKVKVEGSMNVHAKVQEWHELQVLAKDAHDEGQQVQAQQRLNQAHAIECELRQAGHDIRHLVSP